MYGVFIIHKARISNKIRAARIHINFLFHDHTQGYLYAAMEKTWSRLAS